MRRIRRHIIHAIGGNWDMSTDDTVAGAWKAAVYDLRNRVVHAGHFPQMQEAASAFVVMVEFSEFVRERVEASKDKLADAHSELESLPRMFLHGEEEESTFDVS